MLMKLTKLLRPIPNKREYLAQAFTRLGVLWLLEHITAASRPALIVLTYHRIAEPGVNPFYDPVISATPESFRLQVNWLRSYRRLLTFAELVAQLESGAPWREPMMFLTFDDGYRDNFDVALPILRELNVPAMFFIPTAFLESPRLPWWDYVAYVIKQTRVLRFTLQRTPGADQSLPPLVIDLKTMPRTTVIMTIVHAFLDDTIPDEPWFLQQLSQLAEVDVDCSYLGRALFMTWEQVQILANLGASVAVGSHGHSHRKLPRLDKGSQHTELIKSKQTLENRLGHNITALAYPYGWAGMYTETTKALAADAGYHLAFTSREGINRPATLDVYEISRLGVGLGDSPALLRARAALQVAFGASFL
jgi:peptidoglycan/xylan/chitin deacetylase (PgdA/CDA1 family)